MNITKDELYDVLLDIVKNMSKEEKKINFFIDVVGDYINMKTPYSNNVYHYDNINWLCDDLKYCLECEVKRNEKKSNEET